MDPKAALLDVPRALDSTLVAVIMGFPLEAFPSLVLQWALDRGDGDRAVRSSTLPVGGQRAAGGGDADGAAFGVATAVAEEETWLPST